MQPCKFSGPYSQFRVNLVYTSSVALFLLLEVATSFCLPPVGTSCDHKNQKNHWHWSSIIWLDASQSALMVALVIVMWRALLKRRSDPHVEIEDVHKSFRQDSQVRFQTQIKLIALFYVFSSFADWFYYSVGKKDLQQGNIECLNTSFLVPRNN